jgi:hypothetical protein
LVRGRALLHRVDVEGVREGGHFIPVVNIVIAIIAMVGLARNFGKGNGFAVGLILLGFIFIPILAWGDAQYQPQPA